MKLSTNAENFIKVAKGYAPAAVYISKFQIVQKFQFWGPALHTPTPAPTGAK